MATDTTVQHLPPNLLQLMTAEHGQDDALEIAQSFLDGVEGTTTRVVLLRRDMSSPPGGD